MANAAHTLTLAEQHGSKALKDAALRFVAANAVAVMRTDGWKHMAASRQGLKDEVRKYSQGTACHPGFFLCLMRRTLSYAERAPPSLVRSGGSHDGHRAAAAS